jgi:hypothetical protein
VGLLNRRWGVPEAFGLVGLTLKTRDWIPLYGLNELEVFLQAIDALTDIRELETVDVMHRFIPPRIHAESEAAATSYIKAVCNLPKQGVFLYMTDATSGPRSISEVSHTISRALSICRVRHRQCQAKSDRRPERVVFRDVW